MRDNQPSEIADVHVDFVRNIMSPELSKICDVQRRKWTTSMNGSGIWSISVMDLEKAS